MQCIRVTRQWDLDCFQHASLPANGEPDDALEAIACSDPFRRLGQLATAAQEKDTEPHGLSRGALCRIFVRHAGVNRPR